MVTQGQKPLCLVGPGEAEGPFLGSLNTVELFFRAEADTGPRSSCARPSNCSASRSCRRRPCMPALGCSGTAQCRRRASRLDTPRAPGPAPVPALEEPVSVAMAQARGAQGSAYCHRRTTWHCHQSCRGRGTGSSSRTQAWCCSGRSCSWRRSCSRTRSTCPRVRARVRAQVRALVWVTRAPSCCRSHRSGCSSR